MAHQHHHHAHRKPRYAYKPRDCTARLYSRRVHYQVTTLRAHEPAATNATGQAEARTRTHIGVPGHTPAHPQRTRLVACADADAAGAARFAVCERRRPVHRQPAARPQDGTAPKPPNLLSRTAAVCSPRGAPLGQAARPGSQAGASRSQSQLHDLGPRRRPPAQPGIYRLALATRSISSFFLIA